LGNDLKLSYKNISKLELNAALQAARAENTYFGQCQALAWVARYVRDQRNVMSTALAAAATASRDEDYYNAVFPLAWPIRALLERGETVAAEDMLKQALRTAKSITPASSQSEALFLLFQAAMHGSDRLWEAPYAALLKASLPTEHWRQGRNVRDAICIVASVDYHFAKQAAEQLPDQKISATVLDLLSKGKKQTPRPFFW
jgi:hypothetical protein